MLTRSGTTLLQRIVDAHPQIASTHDQCWIARYFKKGTGLTPEGLVTPGLGASLLAEKRFHKLEVGREELERLLDPGQRMSYARFVAELFDRYGKTRGKAWLGTNVRATCANFRLGTTSGPGPICPPDPGWSRRLFVDRQREQTGPYYRPPCLQRRRQGVGRGAHIRAGKVSACDLCVRCRRAS